MVIGPSLIRVDDPSLLLVAALVILVAGVIAYLDDRRPRRKPDNEQERPRRAA
jgi:hypothetical protein